MLWLWLQVSSKRAPTPAPSFTCGDVGEGVLGHCVYLDTLCCAEFYFAAAPSSLLPAPPPSPRLLFLRVLLLFLRASAS